MGAAGPSSKPRMLARLYLGLGGLGTAAGALCVGALLRFPVDDPNDIGFALVLVVLAFAQAVPAAGLPAYLWLRVPGLHPRSWPRSLRFALAVSGAVLLAVDALFAGPLLLGPALAVLGAAFVASRLALLRRGWIAAWLAGSALVVAMDAVAIAIAWDLWRRT